MDMLLPKSNKKALCFVVVLAVAVLAGAFVLSRRARAQVISLQEKQVTIPIWKRAESAQYVSYYDTSGTAFSYALHADSARLDVRISPPVTGVVDSVFFAVNSASSDNLHPVAGRGRLRVRVASAVPLAAAGTDAAVLAPGTYYDSASVSLSTLQPGAFNGIDLTGIDVTDSLDYIVELDVIAATDSASVQFVLDGGATGSNDDNYFPARTRLAVVQEDTTTYERFVNSSNRNNTQNHNLVLAARIAERTGADVSGPDTAPNAVTLAAPYPNPFRQRSTLPFTLDHTTRVELAAYDVLGRRVAVLADRQMSAGAHRVYLSADELPAGVYVVRLQAGARTKQRTVTVVE